jgi:hypothetical protein
MNIFIKNRSLIAQSLFFAATLFVATYLCAAEKPSQFDRASLDPDYGYLNHDGSIKYPSMQILEKQPEGIRYGVCHNYAISKKLGLKGQIPETLPIIGAQDWHEALRFTKNYCEEVSTPQPGDLVTYYPYDRSLIPKELIDSNGMINSITQPQHNDSFDITHTGIAHDNGLVESKWGAQEHVLLHPTFHVPTYYGNHVKYHRINKSTNEIIQDIEQRIPQSNYSTACAEGNKQLVEYAEKSDNFNMWDTWQRCMCSNVEASNDQDQSLLMIGAKNNNLQLVQTALLHKANLDKKDKNGKTAMLLAKDNHHPEIIQILKEQKQKNELAKPFSHRVFNRIAKPSKAAESSFWETTHS